MIKLVVFDFDSTLIDAETLDFLALKLGIDGVLALTKAAMAGELCFFESLVKRVALFKNTPYEKILTLSKKLPLMKGSKELIKHLKQKDIKVVVFSGGFDGCLNARKEELGFDVCFANTLHVKDFVLTGKLGGELMFGDSKGLVLEKLQVLLNLQKDEIGVVGDGANDISMFKKAGTSVAFNAKAALKPYATHIVDEKDLKKLIGVFDA